MSRLQSIVLTVAALTIAANSFVPPWVRLHPRSGGPGSGGEAARVTVTSPLGSFPLNAPPTSRDTPFVRVDYGRLTLYHLATLSLLVPFFVWRRRSAPRHIDSPRDVADGGGSEEPSKPSSKASTPTPEEPSKPKAELLAKFVEHVRELQRLGLLRPVPGSAVRVSDEKPQKK